MHLPKHTARQPKHLCLRGEVSERHSRNDPHHFTLKTDYAISTETPKRSGNLDARRNERSAWMAESTCPEYSDCGGPDRDSINAVEINGASVDDE